MSATTPTFATYRAAYHGDEVLTRDDEVFLGLSDDDLVDRALVEAGARGIKCDRGDITVSSWSERV